MKKLYVEETYKRRLQKRSESELNKIHHPKKKRTPKRIIPRYKIADKLRADKIRYRIDLPKVFSIVENTEENLSIFADIYQRILEGRRIHMNMENIEILTPDAPLYMVSIFEHFELRKIEMNISGNFPNNSQANSYLIQSHFFDYVKSEVSVPKSDDHLLHIVSGTRVDGSIARDVIRFSLKYLNQDKSLKTRTLFKIIIEMMGNTVEHAYRIANERSKWYLMASHDTESGQIRFAFLDGGMGVPQTIRKNFTDLLKKIFSDITGDSNDSRLIMSALQGKFRTRTGQRYRGKGLPNIYKSYYENKFIDNLRIISNVGYIDRTDELPLNHKFYGTLYTWDFV